MSHVAWSVSLSVCVGHMYVLCKNGSTNWWLTVLGLRNNVVNGDQDRTNPFAAMRGDKLAMWFFAKLLWTLL